MEKLTGVTIVRTMFFRLAFFIIVGSLLSTVPIAADARLLKTALAGDQNATVSVANATFQSAGYVS